MGARAIYYLGHTSDLDVSPDGSYLLLLSNHTISILDSETGVIREIIQDTYLENNSISWAPHAELFAASTQNGWLIMDPSSLDVNEHFDGLEGPAEDLSWSPDGSMLAGVADSSSLTVWSAETGAEITSLDLDAIVTSIDSNGFEDDLAHFVWSADSSKILTCSRHGRVATWRVLDGEFLQTFAGGISQVRCQDLDWSPDGSKIAVTSFDKADIWDANIAIHLAEIEGPSYVSTWSPDSAYLAFSTTSFQLAIWDASTGETKTLIDSICGAPLYWSMQEILFAHCGYYLAIYDLSLFR
jgi:WD40 repeat protein